MSFKTFSLRKKASSPSTPEVMEKTAEASSMKRGDEKRIMLMNMVKEGKLSVDNALQRAYGMGIASVPYEELDPETTRTKEKEGEIYNFGVHRYGRSNNKATKCVIQIDCKEDCLSLLQRGQKLKGYPFQSLRNVTSGDDSMRLIIQFDDLDEIELDAATLEEKNRIARLLLMIIGQNHTGIPVHSESILSKRKEVIKEGIVEKKGHSAAFLMWPKRFLRIMPGEMMYFKIGEEKNEGSALSIVSLKNQETLVRKLDNSGFLLLTDQKEYAFRIISSAGDSGEEIEKERNDWVIALQEAMRGLQKRNVDPSTTVNKRNSQNALFHQEEYLKSIATTLNEELEQLGVMLNIIDAPIRASTQVKKVREIVQSLNSQINTGLLSWTLKHAQRQRISISEANEEEFTGDENGDIHHWLNQSVKSNQQAAFGQNYGQGENYSHLHPGQNKKIHLNQEGYDLLNLPSASTNSNRLSYQSNLSVDSRYSPYPNYRAPSISSQMERVDCDDNSDQFSVQQYDPTLGPNVKESPEYARVRKRIKQRESNTLYENIENRSHFMNKWDDDPPPLPPKLDQQMADDGNIIGMSYRKHPTDGDHNAPFKMSDHLNISAQNDVRLKDGDKQTTNRSNIESLKSNNSSVATNTNEGNVPLVPVNVPPVPNNIPAPPPPPGMVLPTSLPPKQDTIPKQKMKPLFWTKVPDALVNKSIWKDAQNRISDLDKERLESMFNISKPEKESQELPSAEQIKMAARGEKQTVKSLLDPKKAQNLGIFLSGFKLKEGEIIDKLTQFDEEGGLSSEEINALKRFQPSAEETEMFRAYKGELEKLMKVDQFVIKMSNIPEFNARLDVLLTIREIPEQIQGIEPPVKNILSACDNLKNNQAFQRLLEYVLALGNYMNGGTNRGRAYGFRLSALVKLVDIRSGDKKHTLLQYLAEELYTKDQKALMCYKDMTSLLAPTDISIKGLTAEIEIMTKEIELLKQRTSSMSSSFSEDFLRKAGEFVESYSLKLKTLREQCNCVIQLAVELKQMYGENASVDFENWLNHISDFIKQLQRASEAAQEKQRRLLNRQSLLAKGELAVSQQNKENQNENSKPKNKENIATEPSEDAEKKEQTVGKKTERVKNKSIKQNKESYEIITSHSTKFKPLQSSSNELNKQPQQKPDLLSRVYTVKQTTVSQLTPSESIEELSFPTKTGYLEKQSGGKMWNRKWDYRFFELTATGYLHYSKREDGKLSGAIYLRGCPIRIDSNDPCIIEVQHEQRSWKLRGYNEIEMMDWYNALSYYSQMEAVDVSVSD